MNKTYLYIGAGVVILVLLFAAMYIWRPGPGVVPVTDTSGFGIDDGGRGGTTVGQTTPDTTTPVVVDQPTAATNKIFKLLDGPVAGAILLEYSRPTTTVARFIMADSGRVFDLPLDVPGAVPRAVSNTTIPGIATVQWTAGDTAKGTVGDGVLVQYIDSGTVKTLHLAFPPATTTLTTQGAVKIKFLPDGITSVAVSPDGTSAAYLLKVPAGADGYTTKPDGTSSKKLFSLPLSQLLLSWPSAGTLLAQTPAAAGVAGVVFSINATSGTSEPLIYAEGLTAAADRAFSKVVYQTSVANVRSTYVRDVKTGINNALSFDPFPERCVWGAGVMMYCATPLTYVPPYYLDLWHAGVITGADSIFSFNVGTGATHVIASPGSSDGGEQADIASLAVSPSVRYALYVRKGDRSLWAVRLSQ